MSSGAGIHASRLSQIVHINFRTLGEQPLKGLGIFGAFLAVCCLREYNLQVGRIVALVQPCIQDADDGQSIRWS